jgi:hypothetical protein
VFFEGNYREYEDDKRKRLGRRRAAASPAVQTLDALIRTSPPLRGGPELPVKTERRRSTVSHKAISWVRRQCNAVGAARR